MSFSDFVLSIASDLVSFEYAETGVGSCHPNEGRYTGDETSELDKLIDQLNNNEHGQHEQHENSCEQSSSENESGNNNIGTDSERGFDMYAYESYHISSSNLDARRTHERV